ncbi:MAG: alpha/beta fold hydrolase [Bryobacteraceae bacterium]|nr:alpha/beta fold hydrolase [Bryobacteraceae bacterium]
MKTALLLALTAALWGQQPDLSKMKSQPFLPDPLRMLESGKRIVTRVDWGRQRELIRGEYERWVFGSMPPAPGNLRGVVTKESKDGDVTLREVTLEFGPGHKGRLRVQLLIPPGKGPFPVFLTNHPRERPWALTAVRRGYLGCVYLAMDPAYGYTDDSEAFREVYPEYDFSVLARWAWAGMRAVDYLVTLPEVDAKKIAITGHSRNGKQALLAAAFDERIAAVALSSGNTGEGTPWRYTSDPFVNESIEQITGNFPRWFHPRLRLFMGREDKLPVDQNLLMAMVAPRAMLMASAWTEGQGAPWAWEQAYRSVQRVYRFFGAPEKLGLSLRAGEHATVAEDIERYIDFFDAAFVRRTFARPETIFYGFDYDRWKLRAGPSPSPPLQGSVTERVRWSLGEEPPGARYPARTKLQGMARTSDGWPGVLYGRPLTIKGVRGIAVPFGDDLKGDLYVPEKPPARKLPVVIWLHPYSHATGYSRWARPHIGPLVERGFAVFAFDQIGFGSRVEQARLFYERYPRWSLLGKMVADTRAAVDALAAMEELDASKIFLAGYSLGGKAAIWTAALEPRVKGIAVASAFAPLRSDAPETEGLRHYTQLHGLAPRLAEHVPVDYGEILSALHCKALVIAPLADRYHPVEEVRKAVAGKVDLQTPDDWNRFPAERLQAILEWLAQAADGK